MVDKSNSHLGRPMSPQAGRKSSSTEAQALSPEPSIAVARNPGGAPGLACG